MNRICSQHNALKTVLIISVFLTACDQIRQISSGGGGGGKDSAASKNVAENSISGDSSGSGGSGPIAETQNTVVRLDAFTDFDCTSNWTNRDGGLGLTVGSGQGTCQSTFEGGSGTYKIELVAQTEREGQSPYRVSINGKPIGAGKFPFAQGKLICECYRQPWTQYCPDIIMNLDVGTHYINTGDIIEYYGEEEYLCGKHGAYSKWRGMVFTPVK